MVLAVVNVGHILILQPLCQFHQRSFSLKKDLNGYRCCLISLWADVWLSSTAEGETHLFLLLSCVSHVVCTECRSNLALGNCRWFVWTICKTYKKDDWAAYISTTQLIRETIQAVYFYRISVALPVKGPNLISSKGGWKPRICRASSWEMGGRLEMKIYTVSVSAASKGAVCKTFIHS